MINYIELVEQTYYSILTGMVFALILLMATITKKNKNLSTSLYLHNR